MAVAEHREGRIAPVTYELVAKGRELAATTAGTFRIALLGHDVGALAGDIAARGGVEVLHVDDAGLSAYTAGGYSQVLTGLLGRFGIRILLLPHTTQGYDLAPRLAAEWTAPIVANCVDVTVDGESLVVRRKILNDKLEAELEVRSEGPYIVTLRPGSVKPAAPGGPGSVSRVEVPVDAAKNGRTFLGYERPEVQDIDIASADIVVSAGRGIQKKENLRLVEELAKTLGGVVGASRPLTDLEWLPKTRQVGQSGKTVRPKLYVACGISGAMQHLAGMKDAGLILAINTDPSAPIFDVAHYGVVANVLEFLPALVQELKKR